MKRWSAVYGPLKAKFGHCLPSLMMVYSAETRFFRSSSNSSLPFAPGAENRRQEKTKHTTKNKTNEKVKHFSPPLVFPEFCSGSNPKENSKNQSQCDNSSAGISSSSPLP